MELALRAAEDKKAERPEVLELSGLSDFTDYFVIVSGKSHRQVVAIADGIQEALAKSGVRPHHVEGHELCEWILLDLGDVVVHVFADDKRLFYDLEGLWRDARRWPQTARQGGS